MKHVIILLLLFASTLLSGQTDNTIDRGSGIMYFSGVPGFSPDTTCCSELAYNILTREFYVYNRTDEEFNLYLNVTQSASAPSSDPGTGPRLWLKTDTGVLYWWDGSQWLDFTASATDSQVAITANTVKVYCPSHGLDTASYTGKVIGVRAGCTPANSLAADSIQTAYIVGIPDADTVETQVSGLVYRPSHGLPVGRLYYLQDSPNGDFDTIPGTVSSRGFLVVNDDYIHLIEPAAAMSETGLPVVTIPAAALSYYGTDPVAPNDTIVQNIAELYAAAGLIVPGSFLITTSAAISDNEIYRPNDDGSATPSHSWHWNGQKVTRINILPGAIDLADDLYGGSGILELTPLEPAADDPTTAEVVIWLETNYDDNGLRLPNGSLLYWVGAGSTEEPDFIWVVIDDLSSEAVTNWARVVKQIKAKNLGLSDLLDHTANQNIALGSYRLSGDGDNEGIKINSSGIIQMNESSRTDYKVNINSGSSGGGVLLHDATSTFPNGTGVLSYPALLELHAASDAYYYLTILGTDNYGKVTSYLASGTSFLNAAYNSSGSFINAWGNYGYGGYALRYPGGADPWAGMYVKTSNLLCIGTMASRTSASSNGTAYLSFTKSTSRVGVNNESPATTLDVNGNARIRGGTIEVNNGGTVTISNNSGSPNGVLTAAIGSSYYDTTNGVPYFKKTGSGNTGWIPYLVNTVRSGTATITGDADGEQTVSVTFSSAMPDTGYNITLSLEVSTGTLDLGEQIAIISSGKTTSGFTISLAEAIETGEEVFVHWSVVDQ